LVKGFEYERDRYVVVAEDELEQMAPPSSRVMEVREFVPIAEIDPVYLDASYYVVPETAGEKPYTLLYEVLRRSGHAAVAQWTCHNREYLVLLRSGRFGLLLHTVFYADEVRALDEFRTEVEWVSPRELELAGLLVEALAARFEPAKYRDTYRENVRTMLDAKIRGEELKREEPAPPPVAVLDILEGLKASLARAKKPAAGARRSPARLPAAAAR
jgi:DNA end-binding protein Ku